jgi:hypothetical protein
MENWRIARFKIVLYLIFISGCFFPQTAVAKNNFDKRQLPDSTNSRAAIPAKSPATLTTPAINAQVTPKKNDRVQVLGINVGGMFDDGASNNRIVVNDKILIKINNPKGLLALKPNDQSQLILYADQLPLTGISSPYFSKLGKNDLNDNRIIWPDTASIPFIFSRDSTNTEAWNTLFRVTKWNKNETRFHLSLGWAGMFPVGYGNNATEQRVFDLVLYNTRVFWFLLGCYLGFMIFFVWLCKTTGLIREPDNVPSGLGPFSLAQTQLAFWTVIIVGGFIYLTILTGLTNSLNDSSLLLLGITGGTTGVAAFIDYFKKEGRAANTVVTGNSSQPIFVKPKRGFLVDISSDGINLTMQRAQTIMWNLVLGLYFIWYVVTNKAMPVFSNTLLTVAGVSSLVYLSSKGPEQPTPTTPPTSTVATDPNQQSAQ